MPKTNTNQTNTLTITNVSIRLLADAEDSKIKAYATLVVNDVLRLRGLKVVEGAKGPFVGYPSYLKQDGQFQEIYLPVDKTFRENIRHAVLEKYVEELAQQVKTAVA